MSEIQRYEIPKCILKEKELLFSCAADTGFIERLVNKFIPRLRSDSEIGNLTKVWEQELSQHPILREKAYRELNQALIEIEKVFAELGSQGQVIYFDKAKKLTAYEEIIEDICAKNSYLHVKQPPYQRLYYKIRALYATYVVKSHEIEFAPTATLLIEKNEPRNSAAMADYEPTYLWRYLKFIEDVWLNGDRKGSIGWERIPEGSIQMWLDSDNAFRAAQRNYVKGELVDSDIHSYRREFFDRAKAERVIERLLAEIEVNLVFPLDNSKISHRSSSKRDEDVKSLISFAKDVWIKKISDGISQKELGRKVLAKEFFEKIPSVISLHVEGEKRIPRLEAALEITDPRIYEGGKFCGYKPHWKNFSWVE